MIVRELQRFILPKKIIFPKGNDQGEFLFPMMNKSSYLQNHHAINCLLYQNNASSKKFITLLTISKMVWYKAWEGDKKFWPTDMWQLTTNKKTCCIELSYWYIIIYIYGIKVRDICRFFSNEENHVLGGQHSRVIWFF